MHTASARLRALAAGRGFVQNLHRASQRNSTALGLHAAGLASAPSIVIGVCAGLAACR